MRFTVNELVKALEKHFIRVEAKDIEKNGVTMKGVCITSTVEGHAEAGIIIYPEMMPDDLTIEDVVEHIRLSMEEQERAAKSIKLEDKEWVLSHLKMGIAKAVRPTVVSRDAGIFGCVAYLFVDSDEFSADVTEGSLELSGISEAEAWAAAEDRLRDEAAQVRSLHSILFGDYFDDEGTFPIYVVTSKTKYRGAVQILNKKLMQDFAKSIGVTKLIAIPSSVHEVLVAPYEEKTANDMGKLNAILNFVNGTQVKETEQLGDTAVVFDPFEVATA